MPSSSARCAQFPRAQDKVHYFIQIKQLRDEINGVNRNNDVQETNYAFDLEKATGKNLILLSLFNFKNNRSW